MSSDNQEIKVMFILEALGRPAEHLKEFLEKIVEKIDSEKGVKITDKKINEPVPLKNKKDFFTTFAELELEVKDIHLLAALVFKYMPAHIDIIYPENFIVRNNDFTMFFNELTRRLHGYDEIARILQIEKVKLEKKLSELLKESKFSKKSPEKSEE